MPQDGVGYTLQELADRVGARLKGDGTTRIFRVASLEAAGPGDIGFCSDARYQDRLHECAASALIVAPAMADAFAGSGLLSDNPYACYARVATVLNPTVVSFAGVHPSVVSDSPLPADIKIDAHVRIGSHVKLGQRVVLHAGVSVGDGVSIGDDTIIYPQAVIYHDCQIGARCVIHAGASIGADGFGFAPEGKNWVKIPQVGRVLIGDDVEFGANSAVDRGTLQDTVIGDGCKIDNLIHIGHNCKIGPRCVMAACTGVAGSVTMGEHCVIGGAGMISGHLSLCPDVTISGGSLVMKSIRQPGRYTSVFPLDSHEAWIHNASHIRRLSKLSNRITELEKQLSALSSGLSDSAQASNGSTTAAAKTE